MKQNIETQIITKLQKVQWQTDTRANENHKFDHVEPDHRQQ